MTESKFLQERQQNLFEASLSRIWSQALKHQTGTISGFRYAPDCGDGKPYTLADNKRRNSILKAKLLKQGFGVTSVKGTYIENYGTPEAREVDEESFFVVDIKDTGKLKSALIALGTEFEQDSITFAEAGEAYYLISTNECPSGYPGSGKIGVSAKLGKPNYGKKEFADEDGEVKPAEFFSKIKNRPFVFRESVQDVHVLSQLSLSEVRSVSHFATLSPKD